MLFHSRRLAIARWRPTHLSKLAPTALPQRRLVPFSRSVGLSFPLPFSLSLTLLPLWPTLSLLHKKGFSGCSVDLYPPRGWNRPPQDRRGVVCPLRFDEVLFTLRLRPCLLSFSVPFSLFLCVSCSLSPSSSLFLLPTLTMGVSCASASTYTPLHAVPCHAYRRSHGGVLSSV